MSRKDQIVNIIKGASKIKRATPANHVHQRLMEEVYGYNQSKSIRWFAAAVIALVLLNATSISMKLKTDKSINNYTQSTGNYSKVLNSFEIY